MDLVLPGLGLLFWMLVSFGIVLFILKKFAWKPILSALSERENNIEESLKSAERAREEMSRLQADNDKIIEQAKAQRDQLIKEARDIKQEIITEAKKSAAQEAQKIIDAAKIDIDNQKKTALNEMKTQMIELSVVIAEKVLKKEMSSENKQHEVMSQLVNEVKLN